MARTHHSAVVAAILWIVMPHVAKAQSADVSGTYPSSFEKVIDNCQGNGMDLKSETVALAQTGKKLRVTIAALPSMAGKVSRGGKVRAELKRGETRRQGTRARYSLKGSVTSAKLQAVLIIEYYRNSKPLCTQSFKLSGDAK
jgi:hypothetical protein